MRQFLERLVKDLAGDGIFPVIQGCGNTSAIVEQFAEYPWCGLENIYKNVASRGKAAVGIRHVLFGNVDPAE